MRQGLDNDRNQISKRIHHARSRDGYPTDPADQRTLRSLLAQEHFVQSLIMLIQSERQYRRHTFKGLFDVDRFLCTRLKVWNVALGLAERHRPLL